MRRECQRFHRLAAVATNTSGAVPLLFALIGSNSNMSRQLALVASVFVYAIGTTTGFSQDAQRPNIVLVMADDQGWVKRVTMVIRK